MDLPWKLYEMIKKMVRIDDDMKIICTFTPRNYSNMAQVEYITINNASRKVLNKMRKIGEEKAQRLQEIQERWDAGDIKDVEVVQL